MKIYTIGYGSNTKEEFLNALKENNIGVLVDVRSNPYSKWQKWTNREDLREWLNFNNIFYVHSRKLGGMPLSPDDEILEALHKLEKSYEKAKKLLEGRNLAIMCSEADPDECHRKDIARVGEANGFKFEHIIIDDKVKDKEKLKEITMLFDFGD